MKLSTNKEGKLFIPQIAVVNADDFGISPGTNKGIEIAYKKGILTSASIMPSGPAFDAAIKIAKKNPGLGMGVHLSLTWGKSVLTRKDIPDLVDSENYFYPGIAKILLKVLLKKSVRSQIKREFEAQVERVLAAGITPDHLNGQEHVHFLPFIFPIVVSLAKKNRIGYVRIPLEPLFKLPDVQSLVKWAFLQSMGYILKKQKLLGDQKIIFHGILFTSKMDKQIIKQIIQTNKYAAVEILTHPGLHDLKKVNFHYKKQKVDEFLLSKNRLSELSTVQDKSLIEFVKRSRITLSTFGGNR